MHGLAYVMLHITLEEISNVKLDPLAPTFMELIETSRYSASADSWVTVTVFGEPVGRYTVIIACLDVSLGFSATVMVTVALPVPDVALGVRNEPALRFQLASVVICI